MKFSGIIYIDKDIILEIHRLQIEEHGGTMGVRSMGGLESAHIMGCLKANLFKNILNGNHFFSIQDRSGSANRSQVNSIDISSFDDWAYIYILDAGILLGP